MATGMSVLKNLERTLAGLVEGTFGRVFRSEVRPVEIARKLAKEMEEHKTHSVSRTYVPNEYVVWLGPEDRRNFAEVEHELSDELCAYLLEHARRERLDLVARPSVAFATDERLQLGEFGIQARLVRPGESAQRAAGAGVVQAEHGQTMVYSTADRLRGPVEEATGRRVARAVLLAEGRRHVLSAGGATIGRSRDCDIVLSDPNVSRRHAEVRPTADGGFTVADLGSTNGVRVNGRPVSGAQPLRPGDRVELGTAEVVFDRE